MKLKTVRAPKPVALNFLILVFIILAATSCSKGSKDKPVLLGTKDQSNITGKALISMDTTLKAELYNGTDWTLTDVDIIMQYPEANMKRLPNETRDDFMIRNLKGVMRRFRLELRDSKPTLKPFTTGEFFGDIGDFLKNIGTNTVWSWEIVSARGFKE